MKTISLWQPWASLVAWGEKEYETRSWKPHGLKRGDTIAIHAAKRFTKEEREYCHLPHFQEALQRHSTLPDDLPLGAVLCVVQLVSCHHVEDVRDGLEAKERTFGNYQNGRYAWQFKVIHVFDEPIPAKGSQGIWGWEPPVSTPAPEDVIQHTVTLYTGRIDCGDPDAIDTTIKSASTPEGEALAPTWDMVMASKRGELAPGEYDQRYYALMRQRWQQNPAPFLDILKRERAVLTCYCNLESDCHRDLALDVLTKVGEARGIRVVSGGQVHRHAAPKTEVNKALAIAQEVVTLLKPHCQRIQIAGSVRRKKPNPKDIEIVVIPTATLWPFVDELLAMGHIIKALYGPTKQTRWGERYRGFVYDGMTVELFTATPETWGNQLLIRTGPGDANQRLMQILNRYTSLRFKDGAVWHSEHWVLGKGDKWEADDRQHIPLYEEADVFKLLGMDFVEPEQRHERMYNALEKTTHAWPVARQFVGKPKAVEMFDPGHDFSVETPAERAKATAGVTKPIAFEWPDEMKLNDGRVAVPSQHGWTVCRTTDIPAVEYAAKFQRGLRGWDADRLALDARLCRWERVKERVR